MTGICAYFKCASAHLNTPMCYVVLCVQRFIKIAPTKDELLETIPKFRISIPFCRLVSSFSSGGRAVWLDIKHLLAMSAVRGWMCLMPLFNLSTGDEDGSVFQGSWEQP